MLALELDGVAAVAAVVVLAAVVLLVDAVESEPDDALVTGADVVEVVEAVDDAAVGLVVAVVWVAAR